MYFRNFLIRGVLTYKISFLFLFKLRVFKKNRQRNSINLCRLNILLILQRDDERNPFYERKVTQRHAMYLKDLLLQNNIRL